MCRCAVVLSFSGFGCAVVLNCSVGLMLCCFVALLRCCVVVLLRRCVFFVSVC